MFTSLLINTPFIKPNNINRNITFKGIAFSTDNSLKTDVFELSDKQNYKEEDYNAIKNSIKKNKFIGAGFEGRVFEMEDPQYVIKIPKNYFNGKKLNSDKIKYNLVEENITKQDEVNHIVKKYKNGIIVMNKVAGKQIQTKSEMREVADLPVESYQDLLNQIIDAESNGMEFDYAMNNVLYDKETGKLTAIDFRPFDKGKRKFNPLEKIYFVFDCFKQPYEKKVAGKIMSAALNNIKSDANPKKARLNYDFEEIVRLVQYNNPKYWGILDTIKSYTQNIKFDRLNAETKYQLSLVDNDIEKIKKSIKTFLIINESEQA